MKKAYTLTILTLLCSIATAWAEFRPEEDKPYALRERTSGLYLDIQTMGIYDPPVYEENGVKTNNISLSGSPCEIYFEAFDEWTWKIKNANNQYVNTKTFAWNPEIGNIEQNWFIVEEGEYIKIHYWNSYIVGNTTVGTPLFCNNSDVPLQFSLIDLANLTQEYTFHIGANAPQGVSVTYAGNSVSEAQVFNGGFVVGLFDATDVEGYTWEIVVDDENRTITLVYTRVQEVPSQIDCPTVGTIQDGKYHFITSERLSCPVPCNTLRFTLTESDGKFQNGTNRMSLDEFKLYDADDKEVALKVSYISGNNNKTYDGMLDGVNGKYAGTKTWNDGTEDDWFEITLPNGIELGNAFSFSFVTENKDMNAKAFRIDMSYVEIEVIEYAFSIINVPEGKTVEVTYDNKAIAHGGVITGEVDAALFEATEIPGYTWSVEVDEEDHTVTLTYTAAPIVENPSAVVALVKRIGGDSAADEFKFVLDPSINSKQETFILGSEGDKILIKGSTLSAITTGLGWYLNNIAKVNIAWNSLNEKTVSGAAYVDLTSIELPLPAEERHVSDAKYRYYLNYCTFGYSMTSWTWKRWQQEIDWMALHGINMPLQIVGLEEVWRKFLTMPKYKYTAEQAKAFVPGPAFTAWWGMNNLEGWGGTGTDGWGGVQDDAWYQRQQALATQILARQRELGMEPVLPGFSGMVPSNFADNDKAGGTTLDPGDWGGFTRPHIIAPGNENFAAIAADYYQCLEEVMGTSKYYSMDPFHEGAGHLASVEGYATIYDAMEAARPGSQWVIQQWQWYGGNQTSSLQGVPAGKLIVLDLFSDGKPEFDAYSYNGYAPQDAVFCVIPNFGGRSGLMGRLNTIAKNYFLYKDKHATIKGIGAAPEAIEQTPVTYDLLFQLPWMNGQEPDVEAWVKDYAVARYGKDNKVVQDAWELLREGVLNYGADNIQGPVEDVWAARPNLEAYAASSWGSTLSRGHNIPAPENTYNAERRQMLIDAVYKLIGQEDELALTAGSVYESNYLYDLVEFGGGVMADYAHYLLLGIKAAKNAAGANFATDATYIARRDAFLQLILDMDAFRGTNLNFRLGKWTQEARDAAKEAVALGATIANEDWYEFNNARTIITTWGDQSQNSGLKDYSYRSWQGLLADYYYPRWKYYFDNSCTDPANGYFFFEWNWAHGMTHQVGDTQKSTTRLAEGDKGYSYSRTPEGNTVAVAKELLGKYIIPMSINGDTHYAYRYLDNDVSGLVTVPANAGAMVDLTAYFGELTGISSFTSDVVSGSVTDLSQVAIKANAADGAHRATITLNDATCLSFDFFVNPAYYGVYTIDYVNVDPPTSVFMAYNTQADVANTVGYKLLATGTYTANAIGDSYFTIMPSGTGYTLSVQGKYLQAPNLNAWRHLLFSDNQGDAGVYVFEETASMSGIFKMRDPNDEDKIKYVNAYDNGVFGNDMANKANLSTFTFTPVEAYPITIPASGYTTLCLPFNVVLPEGVSAYDINTVEEGKAILVGIAAAGHILKKGTPAIISGEPGGYDLTVTMNSANARGPLTGSLLHGALLQQTVAADERVYRLDDTGDGLTRATADMEVANGCWVEWSGSAESIPFATLDYIAVGEWKLRFEENDEGGLILTEPAQVGGEELVIPSAHIVGGEEKAITALADNFLEGNTTITSIVLPETLTEVGDFSGCTSLQSITFTSNPTINGTIAENVKRHLLLDDSKAVNFNTANENTFNDVTYLRQLPDGVFGSIMLPFVPDAKSLENYAFYALSSSTSENLIFSEVKNPQANTPYLYTKKKAGIASAITAGETTIDNPNSLNTTRNSWVTVGCYANETINIDGTAHYYGISSTDNQFYHVTGSIKAKPYRAYFKNTDTQSAASPKLTLRLEDGDTTTIDTIDIDKEHSGVVYDLLGRRVDNPTKGIYIVNGKKVVIN